MNWAAMSRAERDAAYDNRAAVPDAPALNQARVAASAAFRSQPGARLDLPYGDRPRQAWDLFPAERADAPCLVFIHGGYWQMNRREDFASLVEGARRMGWSAALPGYTLAPDIGLGGIVGEIHRALDWLQTHGTAHGIAGRILLAGWSAGGHLAALALDHPAVVAGLAISGIYELAPLRDTYLNEKLALTEAEIADLSPLRLPAVGKPLVVAYGTAELPALVADSCRFAAYRAGYGAAGRLIAVEGANHFTVLDRLRSGDLLRAAEPFMQ